MATEFDRYNYIISIDIGTTFSGSCFSYIQDKKSIIHIIKWPEQSEQDTFEKTPTACLYSKKDHRLIKWGKSAIDYITVHPNDTEVILIHQFKLKLQDIFQHQRNGIELTEKEIEVRNAAVDYLREIYLYTCNQINQTVPHQVSEMEFRFVLTVPATWVSEDSLGMRLIAIEAGLIKSTDAKERLVVINEALAASLFCEREFCIQVDGSIKKLVKGQRYLVCDAGGGTVDLATYECTGSNSTTKTGRVEAKNEHCQLALESGGCCGSTILDRNMELYLRDQVFLGSVSEVTLKSLVDQFIKEIKHYFGDESGKNNYIKPDASIKRSSATTLITTEDTVMNDIQENDYDYEAEYEDFDGSDIAEEDHSYYDEEDYMDQDIFSDEEFIQDLLPSDYIYFTLPKYDEVIIPSVLESLEVSGSIVKNGEIRQLRIKNSEVAKYVFDPVIEQVIKLIRKQIQKSHTTIESLFLLGGFGQSSYLYKKLHYEFITCTNSVKHLIVPEDGYRASMRGGICYGIDCIGIIPKMHIKTEDGHFCEKPVYKENYSSLVAIEINLFDLSAVYSFVNLGAENVLISRNRLSNVFDRADIKRTFGLFLDYEFDSFSFIDNYFTRILEIIHERLAPTKKGSLKEQDLYSLNDCDTRIYYNCLIESFIHQLFEHILNDYELRYESRSWYQDDVRYSISLAPTSVCNKHRKHSSMDDLNKCLFEKLVELNQFYSDEYGVTTDQYLKNLFLSKAYPSTEVDMENLEYYVFIAAGEIGMAKGSFRENGNILWTKPGFSFMLRTGYRNFVVSTEETRVRKSSSKKRIENSNQMDGVDKSTVGEEVVCQVLTFDLNFSTSNLFEVNDEESIGHTVSWEYENLDINQVDSEIDKGTYTFKKLIKNLVGMVDFMCPEFYKYIQLNLSNHGRHAFGDLFLIPGTNKFIDMKPNLNVNLEGVLHAIGRFQSKEISSKEILDMLVIPWIKYRLTPMIINACENSKSKELHLVFTGEVIRVKISNSFRVIKQFIDVLEDSLRKHLVDEVPIYYVSDRHYVRHVHCLVNGFNSKESMVLKRVTERRYAVHVLNHDVKKQEDMLECMYSRILKKRPSKKEKKSKKNKKAETSEEETEVIEYKFREEGLTLLHPALELNVPLSSIGSFSNPLLEFKVPHECSIAIVLYASEKEYVTDYSISDNSFKKLHRFIFPIKDVTESILIGCKVEKYGLVFTVKQDDYEADYFCPDYLKLN